MSLPKTSAPLSSVASYERTKSKVSAVKEMKGLPEIREKKNMVDHSKPLPIPLQNEFIPEEVLLSLSYATSAGPCPENLLPPKKVKTTKGTLPRVVDHVWQHPIQRNKFKYLIDHPVSLTGAARDISFLYDVKYVKGETRENVLCPPHVGHSLQSKDDQDKHDGVLMPHKPKRLTDTLIPEEFHIVSNTGVSGLECYDDKYTTLLTDSENRLLLFPSMKPNRRVEVVQLNEVMDTMLERAGVESEEYTGPTKVIARISVISVSEHGLWRQNAWVRIIIEVPRKCLACDKIRERYVQMLDQIARQMIEFYKDLVTQRMMDQRILEELYNFKNVIEELTRELCLVRSHDMKLTKEAEKAHKDLAQAVLDAEKNARCNTMNSKATLGVVDQTEMLSCFVNADDIHKASRIGYISSDFAIDLNEVLHANLLYFFSCQSILEGKDILSPSKKNMFDLVISDFKQWQRELNNEKENFTGDILVSKYDTLKIIKHLQESWADIGTGILGRHRSVEGKMPAEQQYLVEILKNTVKLYKEYELRINGDNGVSKIIANLIGSFDFCSFKLENSLEKSEKYFEEWDGVNEKINEMKTQLDSLLTMLGSASEFTDVDSASVHQANIFNMIRQWILNLNNEIQNSHTELRRHMDELHISMIQWMVNLLIIMIPDFTGHDTLPKLEEESTEKHDMGIAQLELDAVVLAKKLSQDTSYLSSSKRIQRELADITLASPPNCSAGPKGDNICEWRPTILGLPGSGYEGAPGSNVSSPSPSPSSSLLSAVAPARARARARARALRGDGDGGLFAKECYEWINTCSLLLSELKDKKMKLLTTEEKEKLLEEEDIIKQLIDPEVDKPVQEDEGENEAKQPQQEEEEEEKVEEKPSTSTEKEEVIRFIGEDENVHSKPLFEADALSSWRESANQGTLTQKYLEAMTVIEHMQAKLMEVESRARRAEERFEDVNEKLHYTLIRNTDLEKELEEMAFKLKPQSEKEEEVEEEKAEEEKEDKEEDEEEEVRPAKSVVKPQKKEAPRKSKTRTKSSNKPKPK
ncbi:axonemal dynein light chain domain-containing protein 1 [Octodon degus]|uniref:Axonemal dynein light chain domain-containing protein 1 n=1 Tax=Octodon degus TaxID=10160 RepID=A0A6P6DH20_OCTDE|nr:axonemal dynein light chain domain-containing protein 1 [Octodon degus]